MDFIHKIRSPFQLMSGKADEANQYNYAALGIVAAIGHIFYYLYWTYIDPLAYESLTLRVLGFVTCMILLTMRKWPQKLQRLIAAYWAFAITYNLPFFFTVNLIRNGFIDIWFVAEATMIFVVILFIPNVFWSLLSIVSGVGLAALYCYITAPASLYFSADIVRHIPIYLLSFAAAYVFSYSSTRGISMQREMKHKLQLDTAHALAGSIAHEIRNALAQVAYSLAKIDKQLAEKEITVEMGLSARTLLEQTQNVHRAIKRSQQVIDIFLEEVKTEKISDRNFICISAQEVAAFAIAEYGYKSDREIGRVTLEGEDFSFMGDKTLFCFVLFNLMKNALYYLPAHPDLKLTFTLMQGDQFHTLTVTDNGPGIAADKLVHLFESFFTFGKLSGSGLGLYFCKRVMQAFGGDIRCESQRGQYTRFILRFPAVDCEPVSADAETHSGNPGQVLAGRSVLVVDDEPANTELIRQYLQAADVHVLVSHSASDALLQLDRYVVDLVLTDLNLPEMDGMVLARMIRDGEPFSRFTDFISIPIIGMSGDPRAEVALACREAGMNAFLPKKPVAQELLLETLATALAGDEMAAATTDTQAFSSPPLYEAGARLYHDLQTPVFIIETQAKLLEKRLSDIDGNHSPQGALPGVLSLASDMQQFASAFRQQLNAFWQAYSVLTDEQQWQQTLQSTVAKYQTEWMQVKTWLKQGEALTLDSDQQELLQHLITACDDAVEQALAALAASQVAAKE